MVDVEIKRRVRRGAEGRSAAVAATKYYCGFQSSAKCSRRPTDGKADPRMKKLPYPWVRLAIRGLYLEKLRTMRRFETQVSKYRNRNVRNGSLESPRPCNSRRDNVLQLPTKTLPRKRNCMHLQCRGPQRERKCAQCARILVVCSAEGRREEENAPLPITRITARWSCCR